MPNLNPAQKLKNEVLQNWGGFKFFLLFFFFFLFYFSVLISSVHAEPNLPEESCLGLLWIPSDHSFWSQC